MAKERARDTSAEDIARLRAQVREPKPPLELGVGAVVEVAIRQHLKLRPGSLLAQAISCRDRARRGVLETSGSQMSPPIARINWWAIWGREVPRDRVGLGLASRMDAPIAPIDVVDDEVEAWETASVRILCALHDSGPELHNNGPHEFQRLWMQGEIAPPREACGDFARLCSASDSQGACQCVQFCPGLCVRRL